METTILKKDKLWNKLKKYLYYIIILLSLLIILIFYLVVLSYRVNMSFIHHQVCS